MRWGNKRMGVRQSLPSITVVNIHMKIISANMVRGIFARGCASRLDQRERKMKPFWSSRRCLRGCGFNGDIGVKEF